jgi:hypothetical protein
LPHRAPGREEDRRHGGEDRDAATATQFLPAVAEEQQRGADHERGAQIAGDLPEQPAHAR